MEEVTLDELISERSEKAHEQLMVAASLREAGQDDQAEAFEMSGQYAMKTAEFLAELKSIKESQ